jgi:hypothetical protein
MTSGQYSASSGATLPSGSYLQVTKPIYSGASQKKSCICGLSATQARGATLRCPNDGLTIMGDGVNASDIGSSSTRATNNKEALARFTSRSGEPSFRPNPSHSLQSAPKRAHENAAC